MKYALISGTRILQVEDASEGGKEPFQVNEAFEWVKIPQGVTVDEWHTYEDGEFVPPPPPPEALDPVMKLTAFLNDNPDVKALLS